MDDLTLTGDPTRLAAVTALAELFGALRMEYAFVGEIALAAWLGDPVGDRGPVDLLALIQTDRSRQIPMMATNRGFKVDEEEAIRGEELDLLPMTWVAGERPVRVHILFATNALYGRMVRDAVAAATPAAPVKVIGAEDLALLLLVSDMPDAAATIGRLRLALGTTFDRDGLNRTLVSIGLQGKVLV
ncbi:MAG TPA: hypothetical protein VFV54_10090 [Thermoanaerobaculia bacterium]|nr:hypothetical protein [Thermoanaerobaculia bacterium]